VKAVVTGAAGFIGSNLTETLLERGAEVVGIDNYLTGRKENIDSFDGEKGFTFSETDIRDGDAVIEATKGADVIFHLAALPSVQRSVDNPRETFEHNTLGTHNLLIAAKENKIPRFIFSSSSSIYGNAENLPVDESEPKDPISPYGASKLAAENIGFAFSHAYGFVFICLRYFNVFGPRQDPKSEYAAVVPKFITAIINGDKPLIYGDGKQTRDFTYVSNVVAGNILAAEKDGLTSDAYNLAAGHPHSVEDLLKNTCELLEKPFDPQYEPPRPTDIVRSAADIRKARSRLGFAPMADLHAGLKRTIKAFPKVAK
jgi:nucleoside-diphosphate-sugar epimerase